MSTERRGFDWVNWANCPGEGGTMWEFNVGQVMIGQANDAKSREACLNLFLAGPGSQGAEGGDVTIPFAGYCVIGKAAGAYI